MLRSTSGPHRTCSQSNAARCAVLPGPPGWSNIHQPAQTTHGVTLVTQALNMPSQCNQQKMLAAAPAPAAQLTRHKHVGLQHWHTQQTCLPASNQNHLVVAMVQYQRAGSLHDTPHTHQHAANRPNQPRCCGRHRTSQHMLRGRHPHVSRTSTQAQLHDTYWVQVACPATPFDTPHAPLLAAGVPCVMTRPTPPWTFATRLSQLLPNTGHCLAAGTARFALQRRCSCALTIAAPANALCELHQADAFASQPTAGI